MKQNIINHDKNGSYHGVQIHYLLNGNISWIRNYNHGKLNGYSASFKPDKAIDFKSYWNMGKRIYTEDHWWDNQIQIRI